MRPVATTRHTLLLAAALLPSTALAGDAVHQVAMGRTMAGDAVRIAVWTSTGPATPEGVHLEITPFPDAPPLGRAATDMTESRITEQLWTVSDVHFDGDAQGGLYVAHVTLLDDEAQVLDTVDVELTAGALTCSRTWTWGGFGSAHAHLELSADGTAGRLGVVVGGPDAPRVASVSVDLAGATTAAVPADTHLAARLDTVQQLWTRTVQTDAVPGDRYQVDGIVLDGDNSPYGSAFVAQLPVAERAPALRTSCAWPASTDDRIAAR